MGKHARDHVAEDAQKPSLEQPLKKKNKHKHLFAEVLAATSSVTQAIAWPNSAAAAIDKAARKSAKKAARRFAAAEAQARAQSQSGTVITEAQEQSEKARKLEKKAKRAQRRNLAAGVGVAPSAPLLPSAVPVTTVKEGAIGTASFQGEELRKARKKAKKAKRKQEALEKAQAVAALEAIGVEGVNQDATGAEEVLSEKPRSNKLKRSSNVIDEVEPARKEMTEKKKKKKKEKKVNSKVVSEIASSINEVGKIVKPVKKVVKIIKEKTLSKKLIVDSDDEGVDGLNPDDNADDEDLVSKRPKQARKARVERPASLPIGELSDFEVLTSRWLNHIQLKELKLERPTFTYNTGKFSAQEDITIRSTVEDYADQHSLSTASVESLFLASTKTRPSDLLSIVARALGTRPQNSLLMHLRRMYSSTNKLGPWTDAEDKQLRRSILEHGNNWNKASEATGRMSGACRDRYRSHIENGGIGAANEGPWTEEEVEDLRKAMTKIGDNNWVAIASEMGGTRTKQQCRLKWNERLGMEKDSEEFKRVSKPMSKGDFARLVIAIQKSGAQDASEIFWTEIDDPFLKPRGAYHLRQQWPRLVRYAVKVDSGNKPFKKALAWGLSYFTDIKDTTPLPKSGQLFKAQPDTAPGHESQSSLSTSSDSSSSESEDEQDEAARRRTEKGKEKEIPSHLYQEESRPTQKRSKDRVKQELASARKENAREKLRIEAKDFKTVIETDDSD